MLQTFCPLPPLPESVILDSGFCAYELPGTQGLNKARSIVPIGAAADFLVLERGSASITLCQDTAANSTPAYRCRSLVQQSGLNHGLALSHDASLLYASSSNQVFRWPFNQTLLMENRDANPLLSSAPQVVVTGINADGDGGAPSFGHVTRTLILDELDNLYISVGSVRNVDENSFRSRIRRFVMNDDIDTATLPYNFSQGFVFADGLRNEVGLAFDPHGVLWGVENGADNLFRQDLGGDIHDDNPGEELNRFFEAGRHYGYPYCWSEFVLPPDDGLGPGTQWAWPQRFPPDNLQFTEAKCRNVSEIVPPVLSMQAHSAPLGIAFYQWHSDDSWPAKCTGAFPQSMNGYAFVAFHGSWNRQPPTGYKVVYIPMDQSTGLPTVTMVLDLLAHEPPNAKWPSGLRPVDVAFDAFGRLLVSSDGTGPIGSMVLRIEYHGTHNETFEDREMDGGNNMSPATTASGAAALGVKCTLCIFALSLHLFLSGCFV